MGRTRYHRLITALEEAEKKGYVPSRIRSDADFEGGMTPDTSAVISLCRVGAEGSNTYSAQITSDVPIDSERKARGIMDFVLHEFD